MKEKRCIIACKVLWREISYLISKSPYVYDVHFLKQGLHDVPSQLNESLQNKIDQLENDYTHILIGYGLCSNGICNISSKKSTLIFIRAHDCISLFLGSKEKYRDLFDKFPGTYWYNTGWIETANIPGKDFYENMLMEYKEKYDEENSTYLMEMQMEWLKKYKTISYITQNIINEKEYIEYAKNAANYFNWQYLEFKGDLSLLKSFINGQWDNERFLVIKPNNTVLPSYCEDTIIKESNI